MSAGDEPDRPLLDLAASDEELERAVVEHLDRVFGDTPREHHPTGAILLREGEETRQIWIVVEGRVELYRNAPGGPVLVHAATTGRIIGLSHLSARERAFFTCRAATDVVAIPLADDELSTALNADPGLSRAFMNLLLRSLIRRHQRSVELQIENETLSASLRQERDELARALEGLEEAQGRLVQAEKMALLGEMSAGIAHELNNPAAAVGRAASHIAADTRALAAHLPHGEWVGRALEAALHSRPRSTSEERRRRRALADALGDETLAARLHAACLDSPARARAFLETVAGRERERLLDALTHAHALGLGVRNVESAAARIAELVQSLRAYARQRTYPQPDVNVGAGLDDTLRLLRHRLDEVRVERRYGDVPAIRARPGELNQVWTNLIVNALDAMGDRGRLDVVVDAPDDAHVRVRIIDDGPGIDPAIRPQLFKPHFTTKGGRVEFGLGLGLAISRQIVEAHGGTIEVVSEPGRTIFTVLLPVDAGAAGWTSADGRKERP